MSRGDASKVRIPPEADALFIRLVTLLGLPRLENGGYEFNLQAGLLQSVTPKPGQIRFARDETLAT